MTLHWKEFEKSLHPQLKKLDAARGMTFCQRLNHRLNSVPDIPAFAVRAVLTVILLGTILRLRSEISAHLELSLGVFSLFALAATLLRARLFYHSEGSIDSDYRTSFILPLSFDEIFRHRLVERGAGAISLFFEAMVFYAFASIGSPSIWTTVGLIICAGGLASLSWALSLWIAVHDIKLSPVVEFLYAVICFSILFGGARLEQIVASGLFHLNPLGWINFVLLEGFRRGNAAAFLYLLPILTVIATTPWSIRKLRALHHDGKLAIHKKQRIAAKTEPATNIQEQILSGNFLAGENWEKAGALENIIGRLLEPRERTIAEVLAFSGLRWSKAFLVFTGWFAAFVILSGLAPVRNFDELAGMLMRFNPNIFMAVVIVALFGGMALVALCLTSAAVVLFWVFRLEPEMPQNNRLTGRLGHRLLPLNYWEKWMTLARINTLLCLFFLPVAGIFTLTPAGEALQRMPWGAWAAYKVLFLVWLMCLWLPTRRFTPNIFEGLKYFRWGIIHIALMILLYAGSALFLVSPLLPFGWLAAVALLAVTALWIWYSGKRYLTTIH